MQGQSAWITIATLCGVIALSITYAANDSRMYSSVAGVSSTVAGSPVLLSQTPRLNTQNLAQEGPQVYEESSLTYSTSAPSVSVTGVAWSVPIVGAFGALCGALVGRFLSNRSGNEAALQPLLMLSLAAGRSLTPTEALPLWKPKEGGYTILDIRSEMEGAEGRIRSSDKGSTDVPLINARSRYDSDLGKKVVLQEANAQFLQEVQAKIPKNAPVIVMCSDGGSRTAQALNILSSAGYSSLYSLQGGYNKWDQLFDREQRPRPKALQESRAALLQDQIQWMQWSSAGGRSSAPVATPSPVASAPASSSSYAAPKPAVQSSGPVGENYADPAFQAATLQAFPPKANATVEETRVLWKNGGYTLVDIRSEMECREGRVRGQNKGAVEMPMFQARSMYDSNLGKRVVTQEVNRSWLKDMTARFPKDAKIIIMCSDGTSRSSQALDLLAAAGYTNLVLLRGGYNRWNQVFDQQLFLRSPAQQAAKAEWLDDDIKWDSWSGDAGVASPPHRPVSPMAAPEARTERPVPSQGNFSESAFQQATKAAFPARGRANVDEARVLWKLDDYAIVDIRSEMEGSEGRIRGPNKGSIDIALVNARSRYDSDKGGKVVIQEANAKWLNDMKARFKPDSKIIIMCSDGTTRSEAAVKQLKNAGFRSVVVMDGGFMAWDRRFDRFLAPREASAAANKPTKDTVQWAITAAF